MQRTKRVAVGLIAVPLTAVLLAACGKSDNASSTSTPSPKDNGVAALTGDEIFSKAVVASKAAKTMHIAGKIDDDGSLLDLDIRTQGDRGVGKITTDGKTFEVTRVGDDLYLKGDDEFWNQFGGAASANLFRDKFVRTTTKNQAFESMAGLLDRAEFFDQVFTSDGTITKGETTEVNGKKAIKITDKGSKEGGAVYVSTTGEPVILRADSTGAPADSGSAKIDFDYADSQINEPPADQVVDFDQLTNATN